MHEQHRGDWLAANNLKIWTCSYFLLFAVHADRVPRARHVRYHRPSDTIVASRDGGQRQARVC